MRMNTCLEASSPRISYSLDFDYLDLDFIPVELTLPPLPPSSNPAFEFGIHGSSKLEQSSADELFENGVILPSPVQMRQASKCEEETQELEASPQPLPFLSPLHPCTSSTGKATQQTAEENAIEITGKNPKPGIGEKIQKKSRGFRRSSSLGSEYSKTMSFLFPLPVLPRSTSVTSAASAPPNPKRRPLQKQQPSLSRMAKSSSLSWSSCIEVAPVLNVPPRRTSRGTANLFGFGCLSLWGKEKKSRGYGD